MTGNHQGARHRVRGTRDGPGGGDERFAITDPTKSSRVKTTLRTIAPYARGGAERHFSRACYIV
jgi:hypothetical protein